MYLYLLYNVVIFCMMVMVSLWGTQDSMTSEETKFILENINLRGSSITVHMKKFLLKNDVFTFTPKATIRVIATFYIIQI